MQIITEADNLILNVLGKQNKKENYKELSYIHKIKLENKVIWHNYLTGQMISFEEDESIEKNQDFLIKNWFYVDVNQDEKKLVDEVRSVINLLKKNDEITSFKILTTTDCNARCYYCYEKNIKKEPMSEEVAEEVSKYIIKNNRGSKVTLSWFGGEPLLGEKNIDIICANLKKVGIGYSSTMISNTYLFNKEMIKKAKELWKLSNIQVTLDGTKDNYNKIKAYIEEKNGFDKVIKNIEMLIQNKIYVNIRLNVSTENEKDLENLICYIYKNIGENKYLSIYVDGLYNQSREDEEKIIASIKRLTKIIDKHSYHKKDVRSLKLRMSSCMADNEKNRGISPNGTLIKCEHHIYDKTIGTIYKIEEDEKTKKEWKEKIKYKKICTNCILYPTCYRLKYCPVTKVCTKKEQEEIIEQNKISLTNIYKEHKNI